MRQRIAVVAGVLAAGMLYVSGVDEARAADGARGATLLLAASWTDAVATFAMLSVPVVLIGGVVGVLGNPLAGVFTAVMGLAFVAVGGGSIDATLRSAESAAVYWPLAGEALLWAVLVAAMAASIVAISERLAKRMPWLAPKKPTAEEAVKSAAPVEQATATPEIKGVVDAKAPGLADAVVLAIAERTKLSGSVVRFVLGGLVTAVVGGAIAGLMARSVDVWQLAWGLGIGFTLGALLAHQMFPTRSPVAIAVAPLLAAAACYAWTAMTGESGAAFGAAYYGGELIGPARALPIMYASAGVAGALMGMGWSQVLIYTREFGDEDEELPEPHVKPEEA